MSEVAAIGFQHVLDAKLMAGIIEKGAEELSAGITHDGAGSRSCRYSVLPYLAPRMWDVVSAINRAHFGFELEGIELPQYTVYEAGDHYDWHMDKGARVDIHDMGPRHRKLSLTVQLSPGSDYEGGELEVYTGAEVIRAKREEGSVLAFPSWILHRVTPVTRGTRRALVIWAFGSAFR